MPFQTVINNRPGKSAFNLSYEKLLTADMGQLIPVLHDEAVPGDVWSIGNQMVIRMMPLVAPVLHEINAYVHYFFVPYRILWDDWEDFISGGVDGANADTIPTWLVTGAGSDNAVGSLWDYFGFPTGVVPADAYPIDFGKRAYNLIYNEFYRDENLITAIDITTAEAVQIRAWPKDYFTSALIAQQRGTAPALPISGTTQATWNAYSSGGTESPFQYQSAAGADQFDPWGSGTKSALEANTVDLSGASTFDVADLRLAFQIQRWMERNNRAGVRYTEFLRGHFGVAPRDDRLDRPEYIGGSKTPLIISEVLQTSETSTTPQGTLAGHGISMDSRFIGKYRVQEYGVILGILSIMPKAVYQQGIDRQWLRSTRYDFYFPEFAHLSEQAIEQAEIYATATGSENTTVFGYQGRYDEMRWKKNMVCGLMRTTLDYWHISRQFASAPVLNQTFVEAVPRKDIFAAPSEPGFIVQIANLLKAVRPLPIESMPGLIDH